MFGQNGLREIKNFEKIFERLVERTLNELRKEYKTVLRSNFSQEEDVEKEILCLEKRLKYLEAKSHEEKQPEKSKLNMRIMLVETAINRVIKDTLNLILKNNKKRPGYGDGRSLRIEKKIEKEIYHLKNINHTLSRLYARVYKA